MITRPTSTAVTMPTANLATATLPRTGIASGNVRDAAAPRAAGLSTPSATLLAWTAQPIPSEAVPAQRGEYGPEPTEARGRD